MWVRKSFLELQWEMKQRQKVFHLELWLSSLLGVMALFLYQKSLWGILLFIGNGGFMAQMMAGALRSMEMWNQSSTSFQPVKHRICAILSTVI